MGNIGHSMALVFDMRFAHKVGAIFTPSTQKSTALFSNGLIMVA
jgi:hypothetical protein